MESIAMAPESAQLLAASKRRGRRLERARRACEIGGVVGIALGLEALLEGRMPPALALAFAITLGSFAMLGWVTVLRRIERVAAVLPRLRPAPCRMRLYVVRWSDGADYAAEITIAGLWRLRVEFEPPERDLGPLADRDLDAIAWLEPQRHSLWAVELPVAVLWVTRQIRANPV